MFDKLGDGQVNYREMMAGLSPLATGTANEKLKLAFELYDPEKKDLKATEVVFVLGAVNNVASWLGDPACSPDDIHALVDDVGGVVNVETLDPILRHPVARQFLSL